MRLFFSVDTKKIATEIYLHEEKVMVKKYSNRRIRN